MLKGERVASFSEAQDQSENSYPTIRERSAKGRVSQASPQHCKPWETTELLRRGFGVKGFSYRIERRVKSSFESSGLGFCRKHASAKARDGVRERNL